jgi:hypothetical protein
VRLSEIDIPRVAAQDVALCRIGKHLRHDRIFSQRGRQHWVQLLLSLDRLDCDLGRAGACDLKVDARRIRGARLGRIPAEPKEEGFLGLTCSERLAAPNSGPTFSASVHGGSVPNRFEAVSNDDNGSLCCERVESSHGPLSAPKSRRTIARGDEAHFALAIGMAAFAPTPVLPEAIPAGALSARLRH